MAARILANLIVIGSGIMARALVQAYRQALANASKNGVAQEAVENIKRASKTMTEAEARQILGVTEQTTWEEVLKVSPPYTITRKVVCIFLYVLQMMAAPLVFRGMITCSNGTRRMGVFISNQRFTEPKNAWKHFTKQNHQKQIESFTQSSSVFYI
ncbi:mitochondrial import inner membrane translocase subunit tim16 [Dorcoceras hygrometricum]|uniref:Mitochondrial import inner membrane translocase subunit tim16 n=1 Tax=Dorcoceras hygrometricum TaxID=472368 RepID=A0A2Z7CP23_9LAMI|nr:mitochondrial import inner membrane translocase subunit tim16 [Dorcoceras hygrometricum]